MSRIASKLTVLSTIVLLTSVASAAQPDVAITRLPAGSYQPQAAVDVAGEVHLIFTRGEPHAADVYYTRLQGDDAFASAMRVNSQPGSVFPIGSVRGAHLAVGGQGRPHIAWMGAPDAEPKAPDDATPMLYTRLNDMGDAFEPQRNVLQHAVGLDGGGTVSADEHGRVYVTWHAGGERDETRRRIWVARSDDDGESFTPEEAVNPPGTGVCACCGIATLANADNLWVAYRAATNRVNRDIHLIRSSAGRPGPTAVAHRWQREMCPMSTLAIAQHGDVTLLAWETEGQVYFARFGTAGHMIGEPIPAPGSGDNRKHPRLAVNEAGHILLVWTEGTGWNRGGSVAWQLFNPDGQPLTDGRGTAPNLPVWSFAATVTHADGNFRIIY